MHILNTILLQGVFLPYEEQTKIEHFLHSLIQDLFIVGGILYVIFALIVIRQIAVMKRTLITPFSPVIKILGYIHLVISILVLVFYIALL